MAKILIAEDDKVTQELYRRILLLNAHSPVCVESGEELMQKLSETEPDLIILDVGLPGDSGIETCQQIRAKSEFQSIPILMISVKDSEEDIMQGIHAGANDYILKPVRKAELSAKVELMLEQGQSFGFIQDGQLFANRYRIIRPLGTGGNSDVHLAMDTHGEKEQEVALKIFKTKEKEENFLPRFLREAYGLSRLNHPNIVKLVDFGNQRNIYYLATEFVNGKSLGEIIKEGSIDEESAVMLALEISKAFAYMNQFGVVHRDIKPDNILISGDGEVILVDFGLAREEHQQTLSLKDEMFGTPQFLSPEYINGAKNVDIKTDIYSLGITIFYAVSGELPFTGRTAMAILHQQLNEPPPFLTNLANNISKPFAELINHMLAKDPEERCTLKEMIEGFNKLSKKVAADTKPEDSRETDEPDSSTETKDETK